MRLKHDGPSGQDSDGKRRREAALQERRAVDGEIRAFWQRAAAMPAAEDATSKTP